MFRNGTLNHSLNKIILKCTFEPKFWKQLETDPLLLERVITCDELWYLTYNPKRQSMHWSPNSTWQNKARMSKSKLKAMMIGVFDIHGIAYINRMPEGQTVYLYFYLEVLTMLLERVRRKLPKLWRNKSWILNKTMSPMLHCQDKRIFVKHQNPLLERPPYSTELAPCDFFMIPKVKSVLKGAR